jgi:hypothetical protein
MAGLLVFAMICRLLALWLYRRETPAETGGERLARLATAVVIPIWAVAAYASYVDGNAAEGLTSRHMAHYPTSWAWVWVLGGVTAAILTALQVFGLIPVWFRRSWTLPRRLAYTAYVALGVTMVGLMHYWNLLGLRMLG